MSGNSEKENLRRGFQAFVGDESLFVCPHCGLRLRGSRDGVAMRCAGGHSFDIARQGYVNLLTRPVKSKYGKPLFRARAQLCRSGLFAPMTALAAGWLTGRIRSSGNGRPAAVLDAGCGEGSHLAAIRRRMASASDPETIWIGADLSKDGISLAAAGDPQSLWVVADLARCPMADGSAAAVLNLLAPSNYGEFARLLTAGGLLLKAIPGNRHLQEVRGLLYGNAPSAASAGGGNPAKREAAERLFVSHFKLLKRERLTYRFRAKPELVEPLIGMTPLSWRAAPMRSAAPAEGLEVTVDLIMLLGRKP